MGWEQQFASLRGLLPDSQNLIKTYACCRHGASYTHGTHTHANQFFPPFPQCQKKKAFSNSSSKYLYYFQKFKTKNKEEHIQFQYKLKKQHRNNFSNNRQGQSDQRHSQSLPVVCDPVPSDDDRCINNLISPNINFFHSCLFVLIFSLKPQSLIFPIFDFSLVIALYERR